MSRLSLLVLIMLLLGVGTISAYNDSGKMVAKADLKSTNPESTVNGEIRIFEIEKGLRFVGNISGALPGKHGIHIHENGDCGDSGNAAGGHYNPHGVQHGFAPKDKLTGAHPGDMGNVAVDKSGHGSFSVEIRGIGLTERAVVANRAIILHEKEDDFGQPTGNAGGRIACGIIEPLSEGEPVPAEPKGAVIPKAPEMPKMPEASQSPWIKKE